MRALLLAAGMGLRLLPITATTPKCLVEINGRPLLDYWLELLFEGGVERALVNTHWLADQVIAFREGIALGRPHRSRPRGGTARHRRHGARQPRLVCRAAFHRGACRQSDRFRCGRLHRRALPPAGGHAVTMLGFRTDTPRSCGILELDRSNTVVAFHEKVDNPPGNLANGAVYILEPDVLDLLESFHTPVIDLSTEMIPKLMGRILAVRSTATTATSGIPRRCARPKSNTGRNWDVRDNTSLLYHRR